jgi:hypothetical protein
VTTPTTAPDRKTIDIGRALSFVLEDPDWIKKLLIGSLVSLAVFLLIGIPLLVGYYQRVIQRTARGERYPLPDWDDWGGLFVDGLKAWALVMAHVAILMVPVGAAGCVVGLLGGSLEHLSSGVQQGAGVLMVLAMLAFYAVMFLGGIALFLYAPAAQTRLALTGSLAEAFNTKANLAFIRRNLANYGLSLVVMLLTNTLSQFGILLCCVGILPASVWAYACFCWALGETARRDSAI